MSETIMLCGKPRGCCCAVTETEYGYSIKDDFGGEIKMTKEEAKIFKEKVK